MDANVQRLKEYQSRLIVFPRRAGKAKKGDSAAAELATAAVVKGTVMPIVTKYKKEKARALTDVCLRVSGQCVCVVCAIVVGVVNSLCCAASFNKEAYGYVQCCSAFWVGGCNLDRKAHLWFLVINTRYTQDTVAFLTV